MTLIRCWKSCNKIHIKCVRVASKKTSESHVELPYIDDRLVPWALYKDLFGVSKPPRVTRVRSQLVSVADKEKQDVALGLQRMCELDLSQSSAL